MSQIEAGRYKAVINSASVTETKNGKQQVSFELGLEGNLAFTGTKSLEGGAFEYTLNALRKFGFNDDWNTLNEQLSSLECSIVIEMEAGQQDPNKLFPKLAWIDPPKVFAKPVASSLLSSLSARAKTIARPADAPPANRKFAPKPAAPKPAPAQQPAEDGDVPF